MELANTGNGEIRFSSEPNRSDDSYVVPTSDIPKIFVYEPGIRIRSINLDFNYSISVLNRIYPNDSIYIYNGHVLDTQKSFKFYNMENGNKIVLVRKIDLQQNPNIIDKWINLTNKKDEFEEKINLNIKSDYRREIARIKDIKFCKMTNKKKRFNNFINSHFKDEIKSFNAGQNKKQEEIETNIDYKSLTSPSDAPLPIVW